MEFPSGRIFKAEKGGGAFLGSEKLALKGSASLDQGVIGIDLNVKGDKAKFEAMTPLCLRAKHVRNMGSAALELCYVASDALDLYEDIRCLLRVTDIAAAYRIILEAGGVVLDLKGNALDCDLNLKERVSLIAGSEELCQEALSLLKLKL
jgi:myo-inositol-1(or 4)-monophosphatase